jgi:hypothetical protein
MHAGVSFSHSPISLLLRQPLSIKKSYAGAIQGPTDFQNVSGISFLPANFTIDEDNFLSITENSLGVLDDFSFKLANNKQSKINFLKVVNYILRHKKITLILVIHNLFGNNLANDILCAHHVFLSYSNLGYLIMR